MENGECGVQEAIGSIDVHNFTEKILEQHVHFHVMKFGGGFFLWVGSNAVLSNLAVSINSKYVSIIHADIKHVHDTTTEVFVCLTWVNIKYSLWSFLSLSRCISMTKSKTIKPAEHKFSWSFYPVNLLSGFLS